MDNKTNRLEQLKNWLLHARPGERFIYLSGIAVMGDTLDPRKRDPKWANDVQQVRRVAWQAYEDGRCHLLQRREQDGTFSYLCERRH
jgi:hypothetical protein